MSRITRREFVKGTVAGGVALAAGRVGLPQTMPSRRPNVLLIIDDQHNPRAMGWTGQTQVKTPSLDRLAAESVAFTSAYCNSPVCAPARHCLYTGLYTPQHGVLLNERPMREDVPTFIARLNRAGYTTASIGKMHNAPYTHRRDFQYVLNHEFYTSDAGVTHYGPWLRQQMRARGLTAPKKRWSRPARGLRTWLEDPDCIAHVNWMPEDLTPEHWITDQALGFIEDHVKNRPGKPFFLHAGYFPPHHPYGPIRKYLELYDPARMELPRNFSRAALRRWATGRRRPGSLSEREVRRWIAHYFGFITQLDAQIGRLLKGLERLGAADNTVVIFTSDHGDLMAEHGRFYKGLMLEGSAGVPMMIRWPGVVRPRREAAPVSHVDFAPTILAAAGVKPAAGLAGDDLRPLIAGKPWKQRPVFSVIHHRLPFSNMMWRKGPYKLIAAPARARDRTIRYQLFDMDKDPYELDDLANDPKAAGTLRQMKDELHAFWRPLERLLPAEMPPIKQTPPSRFTWPADPWKSVRPRRAG